MASATSLLVLLLTLVFTKATNHNTYQISNQKFLMNGPDKAVDKFPPRLLSTPGLSTWTTHLGRPQAAATLLGTPQPTATYATVFKSRRADPGEITKECLQCICQAVSKCDTSAKCTRGGATCGPFRISWPFWADAGKPVPDGTEADSTEAFKACAFDMECASTAVKKYMESLPQDCNGDQKIDCIDYAHMFRLGKYGCNGNLDNTFGNKFKECLNSTKV